MSLYQGILDGQKMRLNSGLCGKFCNKLSNGLCNVLLAIGNLQLA